MIETLLKVSVASLATLSTLLAGGWNEPGPASSAAPQIGFSWSDREGRMIVTAAEADLDWSGIGVVRTGGGEEVSVHMGDPASGPPGDLHNEPATDAGDTNEVTWDSPRLAATGPTPLSAGDYMDFCATAAIDEATLEVRGADGSVMAIATFYSLPVCGEERPMPIRRGSPSRAMTIECREGAIVLAYWGTGPQVGAESIMGMAERILESGECTGSRRTLVLDAMGHHDCMHLPPLPPIPSGFAEGNREGPVAAPSPLPRPFSLEAGPVPGGAIEGRVFLRSGLG